MRTALIVLLFLAVVFPLTAPLCLAGTQYGEWELVMDKNGIKAYSRKVEGSGIFEFRAVAVVDAPIEVVGGNAPGCACLRPMAALLPGVTPAGNEGPEPFLHLCIL